MTDRFSGRVAVVTGGASGIGAAVVGRLAREGATVVVADIADATASPPGVVSRRVDITVEDDVAGLAGWLRDSYGRIDVLVNSAAITDPAHQARDSDVASMSLDVWQRTLLVDLTGTMLVCRDLLPLLEGGGSVVMITSNAGLAGDTSLAAYASAKAGLHQLTRSIATSHGARGVRCNAVSPAHVASPSFLANVPAEVAAMLEANCLLPRLGTVDDVAAAVVFLASDGAAFITGETLRVDGGALAHLPTYAQQLAPGS